MMSAYICGFRSQVRTVSSSNIRASMLDGHDGMLDLFGRRQVRGVDLVEAAAEPGERADVRVDGGPAQVLEEVVVEVDAVQARLTGADLVQIGEVVVDEMRKWLRWVHAGSWLALCWLARGAHIF